MLFIKQLILTLFFLLIFLPLAVATGFLWAFPNMFCYVEPEFQSVPHNSIILLIKTAIFVFLVYPAVYIFIKNNYNYELERKG